MSDKVTYDGIEFDRAEIPLPGETWEVYATMKVRYPSEKGVAIDVMFYEWKYWRCLLDSGQARRVEPEIEVVWERLGESESYTATFDTNDAKVTFVACPEIGTLRHETPKGTIVDMLHLNRPEARALHRALGDWIEGRGVFADSPDAGKGE